MNLKTPLSRLRLIGLIEGISCILLFFVAMPMKYAYRFVGHTETSIKTAEGQESILQIMDIGKTVVTVVGGIHGFLFLLFLVAVASAWKAQKWPMSRAVLAGIASIPPGGTFILDRSLKKEQQLLTPSNSLLTLNETGESS